MGKRDGYFEGIRSHGTDVGGDGYIHPRSNKYRENFDKIKWHTPDLDKENGETDTGGQSD